MIRHALASGGRGYVQKARANRELLSAIDAVLMGIRYVGSGLRETGLTKGFADRPAEHNVQFYSDDAIFAESIARFVATPREQCDTVLVFTTKPHREALNRRLRADGFDLERAVLERKYIWFDSNKIVARFMDQELPDPGRFFGIHQ